MFFTLVILTLTSCYSQKRFINDKIVIHKLAIKSIKEEKRKFSIFPVTKKSSLQGFDFIGGGRGLDTISLKPWNEKEWIEFINNIDTSNIEDYSLKENVKFNTNTSNLKSVVVFAPVIISNNKALCVAKFYSKTTGSSSTSWFFKKNKNVWEIVGEQVFSITDP